MNININFNLCISEVCFWSEDEDDVLYVENSAT